MAARVEEESEGASIPEPIRRFAFVRRSWSVFMCALRGIRTLLACAGIGLAGVLDQFEMVDILAWVRSAFHGSAKLGSILIAVAVGFFCLRLLTKGPVGVGRPLAKGGIDEGG